MYRAAVEVPFSAIQVPQIERVGRRLVDENPRADPFLDFGVEFPRGEISALQVGHDLFGPLAVAAEDLHQGPLRPFQPEGVLAGESVTPLAQRFEGEEFQLRRGKQLRVAAQQDPQEG